MGKSKWRIPFTMKISYRQMTGGYNATFNSGDRLTNLNHRSYSIIFTEINIYPKKSVLGDSILKFG